MAAINRVPDNGAMAGQIVSGIVFQMQEMVRQPKEVAMGALLQMEASYRCYLLKSGQIDAPVLREYWWYRCWRV